MIQKKKLRQHVAIRNFLSGITLSIDHCYLASDKNQEHQSRSLIYYINIVCQKYLLRGAFQ
jgi:hypothetical protein